MVGDDVAGVVIDIVIRSFIAVCVAAEVVLFIVDDVMFVVMVVVSVEDVVVVYSRQMMI